MQKINGANVEKVTDLITNEDFWVYADGEREGREVAEIHDPDVQSQIAEFNRHVEEMNHVIEDEYDDVGIPFDGWAAIITG